MRRDSLGTEGRWGMETRWWAQGMGQVCVVHSMNQEELAGNNILLFFDESNPTNPRTW